MESKPRPDTKPPAAPLCCDAFPVCEHTETRECLIELINRLDADLSLWQRFTAKTMVIDLGDGVRIGNIILEIAHQREKLVDLLQEIALLDEDPRP